jgi:FAD binding domain-containing protein
MGTQTIGEPGSVEKLAEVFTGEFMLPADPSFDQARRVWNVMIDKRPSLIVRPRGTADVLAAVGFAVENGLPVAVRCGGHSVAGKGVCDDGLLIDQAPDRGQPDDDQAGDDRAGADTDRQPEERVQRGPPTARRPQGAQHGRQRAAAPPRIYRFCRGHVITVDATGAIDHEVHPPPG